MTRLVIVCVFVLAAAGSAHAGEPSGWKFHLGEKGKPAVLLIHGLAASGTHWTSPADTWSIKHAHFKHWKAPKKQSGSSTLPKIKGAIRSIVVSAVDKKADEDGSFWTYLVKEGYTVATWNQVPCMDTKSMPSQVCMNKDVFDAAYPTAREALAHLATLTTENIAIVAHSRGGLIGRKLLKESDTALPSITRVKWFVTLHTPHQGSSMATKGNDLQKVLKAPTKVIDLGFVPDAVEKLAKKLLPKAGEKLADMIDVLVVITGLAGARELDHKGAIIKGIADKEAKRPGVKYYTFGGTSPRVARLWARVYTNGGLDWKTEGREILDYPQDLKTGFVEMKKGGDLLVTDASSHFVHEDKHFTNKLNHAEVLWNKGVQKKVASLLVADANVTDEELENGTDDADEDGDDDDGSDAADGSVEPSK